MSYIIACKEQLMLLSTTLCYLLHHFNQQHGPKSKAMFVMKILLARSRVAKYNLVIVWHYWENGHFGQNQVIAQTLPIRNSIFTRHISQHHAIIFLVLQSITLTLHLGYPSTVGLPYVTINLLQMVYRYFTSVLNL